MYDLRLDRERLYGFAGLLDSIGDSLRRVRSSNAGVIPDDRATKAEIVDILIILGERAEHINMIVWHDLSCANADCAHCREWEDEEQLSLYRARPSIVLVQDPMGEDRKLEAWVDGDKYCAKADDQPGYIGMGDDLGSAIKNLWKLSPPKPL
jgi:hypothetical protein